MAADPAAIAAAARALEAYQLRLEKLSAETQKPIVVVRAYHDKPNTEAGRQMKPEGMDADDFHGVETSSCCARERACS